MILDVFSQLVDSMILLTIVQEHLGGAVQLVLHWAFVMDASPSWM